MLCEERRDTDEGKNGIDIASGRWSVLACCLLAIAIDDTSELLLLLLSGDAIVVPSKQASNRC